MIKVKDANVSIQVEKKLIEATSAFNVSNK